MRKKASKTILRRYTDLPALIRVLKERKITLLDPQSWDDSNDSYYLKLYKEKKGLQAVLALCFTQASETYHHWRVFASGSSGVCVSFHRADLLTAVKGTPGLQPKAVKYLTLSQIRDKDLAVKDLPFLKRYAFGNEDEFRMIFESESEALTSLDVDIPLECIDRVTLSPWLHPNLSDHVKALLRSIDGCPAMSFVRSTLIGNEEWKELGQTAI
jgi:hypothetical protein